MCIQDWGVVCAWFGVGGAGCETVSCLQSGGTRLTTPFGQPYALIWYVRNGKRVMPPSSMHTQIYPVAACGHIGY